MAYKTKRKIGGRMMECVHLTGEADERLAAWAEWTGSGPVMLGSFSPSEISSSPGSSDATLDKVASKPGYRLVLDGSYENSNLDFIPLLGAVKLSAVPVD